MPKGIKTNIESLTVLKVAICPITFLAGSILQVTDNLATDTSQLLITALILCNGSELTALQSTNYQQHFPKDMNNSPCETEAQGTTPSSCMRLIHNMNSSKGLLHQLCLLTRVLNSETPAIQIQWRSCQKQHHIFSIWMGVLYSCKSYYSQN